MEKKMTDIFTIQLYKYIMTYKIFKKKKKIHSEAAEAVLETYKTNVKLQALVHRLKKHLYS